MITEYDVLFIFEIQDPVFKASLEKVKALLKEKGAEIVQENDMGIRKLAYEVKKRNDGHYYELKIKIDGLQIKPLNEDLRLYEDVLKYMFVKKEYKKRRYPLSDKPVQVAPVTV